MAAKAELVRFYGLSLNEIDNLTLDEFYGLQKAMQAIEARELLALASVLDFPHLKEQGRRELVRKLQSIIKSNSPGNNHTKRALTNEELFAIIGGVTNNEEPRSG